MLLTYREETKQPRRPIAGLPAPWVLSSAGKLIRYLHGSSFLPYRNTVSTPDTSGTARQNTIELIIISDAVYTGCRAATWQIPDSKLLPRSIYDILTQILNLLFHRRFPLLFLSTISIFLSSLGSANVRHVHWWALSPRIMSRHAPYCWLATSLFWYWPDSVF